LNLDVHSPARGINQEAAMADETDITADIPRPRLLSITEACEVLRIKTSSIYLMRRSGAIRFTKIGGRSFVTREEIERVIAEGTDPAPDQAQGEAA
jgi:excisionase family DNA binding protein